MRISHVCAQCSHDLTRVRALIEPHYGFPLVTCPGCQRATVRRTHPLVTQGREGMRTLRAALYLIIQILLAITVVYALVALNTATAYYGSTIDRMITSYHALLERIPDADPRTVFMRVVGEPLAVSVGWLIMSVIGGAWLTISMRHHPPIRRWIAWAAVLLLSQGLVLLVVLGIDRSMPPGIGRPEFLIFLVGPGVLFTLSLMVLTIVLSTIGYPIGWGILKLGALGSHAVRRLRRRALRNRRRLR